jgi:hypothetical protein
MGGLLKFLGGPIGSLVKEIGGVIDSLSTTSEEKLEAKAKLLELQRAFQTKVMEVDVQFAAQQAEVIKAEVASESWLAKSWRPILMMTFTFIIAWNFIIAPLFSITAVLVPEQMWELLKIGMGGYIFGRSAEKIIPGITEAIAEAKKK